MTLGIVFAITQDSRFHFESGFPWSIPGYLDFFNATINNNPIIMGSGTWDYLGRRRIPGNESLHILLSHKELCLDGDNCSNPEYFDAALDDAENTGLEMAWIVGGSEIITKHVFDADVIRIAYLNEGVYTDDCYKINQSIVKYCKGTATSEEIVFQAQDFQVVEYRFSDEGE